MADVVHTSTLGLYEGVHYLSGACGQTSAIYMQIATWGPFIFPVSVSITAGSPPPGKSVFLCSLGGSGTVYMVGRPTRRGVYNYTVDILLSNGGHAPYTVQETVAGSPPSLTSITPDDGTWEGGTPVTIHGTGFAGKGIADVYFGQAPATAVVVVSDTTITCVSPGAGNGPVHVEVTLDIETVGTRLFFSYVVPAIGEYEVREAPGIFIQDQRNDSPSSAQFSVQTTEPECGQGCRVIDPSTRRTLHTGSIVRTQSVVRPPDIAWAITATNYAWLLNRRRPFGTYSPTVLSPPAALGAPGTRGVPADVIAIDLITRFASGFTVRGVTPNLPEVTITFDGTLSFTGCLAALCAAAARPADEGGPATAGLIFRLEGRDLVLGYDVGIVDVEDNFVGNATMATREQFIGDGVTVTFPLSLPLANGSWPFVVPDYFAIISEQYVHPTDLTHYYNVSTYREGKLGLKSPAQIPAAPTIATVPYAGTPPTSDPSNLYNLRHLFLRVAFLFADGTESFMGPRSAIIDVLKSQGWTATIPVGGAGVIGRRIYLTATVNNQWWLTRTVLDVSNNTTTTVTATSYDYAETPRVEYSQVGLLMLGGDTSVYQGPLATIVHRSFFLPNGLDGEYGITWQYDPVANTITRGAASIGWDSAAQSYIEPPNPTPDGAPTGGQWRIGIGYNTPNPGATSTFPLTHQLVPTPDTGLIGLGYVTYDDGRGPLDESLTEPGDGGIWTWDSGTNAITRTTGNPVTPQPVFGASGVTTPKNISIKYSSNNGVYEQVIDARLLLMDPLPSKTVDITQLRNRFIVHGVGTTVRVAAGVGAMGLSLNDATMFLAGGKVLVGVDVYEIGVVSYGAVPGISLTTPTVRIYEVGTPVRVRMEFDDLEAQTDRAAIEGGDGVHEGLLTFSGWLIGTDVKEIIAGDRASAEAEALTARAETALATWARGQVSITYATRDPNTRSGSLVTFDRPDLGFVGTFRIQTVNIDQINIAWDGGNILVPRFTVTAAEVRLGFLDLLRRMTIDGGGSDGGGGSTGGGGGRSGGGGGATIPEYRGEVPAGAIDGVNDEFALAHIARPGTLMVYLNGLRQFEGQDYEMLDDHTFRFFAPPLAGWRVVVDYRGY